MEREKYISSLNKEYSMLPEKNRKWSLSRSFVPGEGPLDAKVMIIGQAPGRNEDVQKRPFIGTSGKFLDRLIKLAGLERESTYICSVVQFFPPDNRIPTDEEVDLCKGFLFRQIEMIDPKFVILLGALSSKTVMDVDKVSINHGKAIKKNGRTYFISMHPAAAVRIRTKMPIMEEDFRKFGKVMR
jgi:uracil-DNA glycosylase